MSTDVKGTLDQEFGSTTVIESDTSSTKRWSTENPVDHALLTQQLKAMGVPSSVASDLANQLAQDVYDEQGTWPTVQQLLNDPATLARVSWTSAGMFALPSVFAVKDAGGRLTYYRNTPSGGLVPISSEERSLVTGLMGQNDVATFTRDEIARILQGATFQDVGGGGGGGGAAAGPRPPVFDRDQLIDLAREKWRGLLLAEPQNVAELVDGYIDRYNSFFAQTDGSGRLDFETYITEKAQETPRWDILYRDKPGWQSPQQYLADYIGAVRDLGFAPRDVESMAVAGASSGASLKGFTERLKRDPGYQAANQGSFSQRFANTLAQIGIRGS